MMPYERFRAWQACDALVIAVYRVSGSFPKHELYGLTSQARRATVSAAVNIAEGSAKHGPREFRRYLDIALGSLSEVSYLLRLAWKLGYLAENEWKQIEDLRADASRLTWRLYEAVARRRPAPTA
jgi:four helix bundle protein